MGCGRVVDTLGDASLPSAPPETDDIHFQPIDEKTGYAIRIAAFPSGATVAPGMADAGPFM